MFKDAFSNSNIMELLGTLSVVIFFSIFLFRSLLSFCLSKKHVAHMSSLPLESDSHGE